MKQKGGKEREEMATDKFDKKHHKEVLLSWEAKGKGDDFTAADVSLASVWVWGEPLNEASS